MPDSRFAKFLMGTGVVVATAAAVGLALGFKPSALPPALLDIAAYKLTFATAGFLLAGGALLRRWERRRQAAAAALRNPGADLRLPEPGDAGIPGRTRDAEPVERRPRSD